MFCLHYNAFIRNFNKNRSTENDLFFVSTEFTAESRRINSDTGNTGYFFDERF